MRHHKQILLFSITLVIIRDVDGVLEKYFSNIMRNADGQWACSGSTADKIVRLSDTPAYNLKGGIPGEVFCTWKCNEEPRCLNFNYRNDTNTCEMYFSDPVNFAYIAHCVYFGVRFHIYSISRSCEVSNGKMKINPSHIHNKCSSTRTSHSFLQVDTQ